MIHNLKSHRSTRTSIASEMRGTDSLVNSSKATRWDRKLLFDISWCLPIQEEIWWWPWHLRAAKGWPAGAFKSFLQSAGHVAVQIKCEAPILACSSVLGGWRNYQGHLLWDWADIYHYQSWTRSTPCLQWESDQSLDENPKLKTALKKARDALMKYPF